METSPHPIVTAHQPAYRRLADEVRSRIARGEITPGAKLPSTNDLAASWKLSYHTVHNALLTLLKEGWIERRHGSGTYALDPKNRFFCAGIFHEIGIFTSQSPFSRNLHFALMNEFERRNKKIQVFIDSRPEEQWKQILPELAEAILHRRIQCLIALTPNPLHRVNLARLPLPTAFTGSPFTPNNFHYDEPTLLRDGIRQLARQGCRSVGLISNHRDDDEVFHQAAAAAGLVTRKSWIHKCSYLHDDLESYGYREFLKLWSLPEKPDGLIVFPDLAARGVITAILESGKRVVSRKMKFVFHRNAHVHLLCPFAVTWAISDENIWARGLIDLIERQFRGEKISPVALPYAYERAPAEKER